MSSWLILLTSGSFSLFLLLMLGIPVFATFLIINVGGVIALFGKSGFGMFSNSVYETATSSSFMTIPLFILLGEILFRSGSIGVLFSSVDRLVGGIRGRLYFLTIALSTVFGSLSGSAVAVATMLGRSLMPDMIKRNYDVQLAATTMMAGASLAPIIPPSIFVIIIGSLVQNVSITKLLVAGIGPGILIVTLLIFYVGWRITLNPALAPSEEKAKNASTKNNLSIARALIQMLPFSLVLASVIGLIVLGIATPNESAATGVAGAVIVAAIYRKLSLKLLLDSLQSAVVIAATILTIIVTAKLFSQLLAFTGVTTGLIGLIQDLEIPAWAMFLLLMAIPLLLCMFIDEISFMLISIPLYMPIVAHYEFDQVWFWTLYLINLTIGSVTPPIGYTLFALVSVTPSLSSSQAFRAAWPVLLIFVSTMIILWFFPQIIVWIPSQL